MIEYEQPVKDLDSFIIDFLETLFRFTAQRFEIINELGIRGIDNSLRRLLKRGILKRVSRGTYELLFSYQTILFQIHVFETREKDPQNKWLIDELDLQLTLEGNIPLDLTDQEIDSDLFDIAIKEAERLFLNFDYLFIDMKKVTWRIVGITRLELAARYKVIWQSELIFRNLTTAFEDLVHGTVRIQEIDL